jgi:hypothetical protein
MDTFEKLARIICADTPNRGKCEKCGFYPLKCCTKFEAADRIESAGFVQVVRCRECKYRRKILCPMINETTGNGLVEYTKDDDFCSYGEMRDDSATN